MEQEILYFSKAESKIKTGCKSQRKFWNSRRLKYCEPYKGAQPVFLIALYSTKSSLLMKPIANSNKSNVLITPKKKKGRHSSKSAQRQLLDNDQFVSPKKRRILTGAGKEELDKLFDKMSDDPFEEIDIVTVSTNSDGNNMDEANDPDIDETAKLQDMENQHLFMEGQDLEWLYDHSEDEDETMDTKTNATDGLAALATGFLQQEQTDELKEALDSTDHTQTNSIYYRFFSKKCSIPPPTLRHETPKGKLSKSRYDHVIKYSECPSSRKSLLSSGTLSLWHQLGWNCPQSIYRWLIELDFFALQVALELDHSTAKEAMTVVLSFWSNLPGERLPLSPQRDDNDNIEYRRNMTVETFFYVLRCYGALNLPPSTEGYQQPAPENQRHTPIPLMQFEWTLNLLTRSLRLWPQAYRTDELIFLAETLLKLGMDPIGVVLLKPVQDSLEAGFMALSDGSWKDSAQKLALHLCEKAPLELQVRFIRVLKPTCLRSTYFRRVAAVFALELALHQDMDHAPTFDGEALGSLLDSGTLFPHLVNTLGNPQHLFNTNDPDYRRLSNCIYLLDYAIGTAPLELDKNSGSVDAIVTLLQGIGRKIGSRLGALDKTKANEAIQRLWSRLAYSTSSNGPTGDYS
ncbi:hypothetical protein [Absidia glauca]|uniref:Coiled-coil SMC6 And NSE5 INteracting (CANIN) domain-containing protein n=1 Tax=Absidia glauca TaxID=4829 RepID=A0A168LCR9_ABSGL|nr:hypothetical protein [Absidia glauca]